MTSWQRRISSGRGIFTPGRHSPPRQALSFVIPKARSAEEPAYIQLVGSGEGSQAADSCSVRAPTVLTPGNAALTRADELNVSRFLCAARFRNDKRESVSSSLSISTAGDLYNDCLWRAC